jgi:hypothetical protein
MRNLRTQRPYPAELLEINDGGAAIYQEIKAQLNKYVKGHQPERSTNRRQ